MTAAAAAAADRLCLATLARVERSIQRPDFDPKTLGVGIVHLGLGAFHRAHQALYTEDALRDGRENWGIVGVSLRHVEVARRLLPQDCLYTVERIGTDRQYRIVGIVRDVLSAPVQARAVVQALASAQVHIITLTVTEKGYTLRADGRLDLQHPDVVADLHGAAVPNSTIGWLYAGLRRRREQKISPPTIISCDNVAANGTRLRSAVIEFAAHVDRDAAVWIERHVRFPNSMVDCIVPATDDATRARVTAAVGLIDAAPVQREDFSEWAIEDAFVGPRPDWESSGVHIVADVADYHRLKLHVLNAAHSALAYLGIELGHVSVREALEDPRLGSFLDRMILEEVAPALASLPVADYWTRTRRRLANAGIRHALAQIAQDGSVKLAQRIFPLLIDNARAGLPTPCLARVVRAWLEYARGTVQDPMSVRLAQWSKNGASLAAALDDPVLFPEPFRTEPRVRKALEVAS